MGKKLFSVLLCLILGMSASFAQTVNVTGKVTDAAGQGLVGASVFVAGTTNGTMTDASGNYSLSVPSNATLTFSFIGFTEQLIAVGGRKVINVILEEDANLLNETIVVAFGTTTKEAFTGSASVVKSEDLQKRSTSNATNARVGSVAARRLRGRAARPDP